MREDFTPDNVEIWIDNWKRKNIINIIAKSWLKSYNFEKINFIINHSSVTIEDFDEDIRNKIKLWPNVLRHDLARGPIGRNINQAYIHTFLSGKKYCIFSHDSYYATPGWDKCIIDTNYDFYSSPQGDGFHIMTLEGLKQFGWWDERYSTLGWHEIDYLARVLIKDLRLLNKKASIVDIHEVWPLELDYVDNLGRIFYNSCDIEKYVIRFDKSDIVQIGPRKNQKFNYQSEKWHKKKWKNEFSIKHTLNNLLEGPKEEEINWYPWLDLDNLDTDLKSY